MTGNMSSRRKSQASRSRKPRKSKATIFTHRKFLWLEQVARDRGLPALASAVCILLSPYFNLSHDGTAWPYQDTLAASLGLCRETVNRIIKALIERGHLEVTTTRGRHKASVYRLVLKEADTTKCDQPITLSEPENVIIQSGKCDHIVTQTPLKTPVASKEATRREREDALTRIDSSPGGDPPLTRDPAEEDSTGEEAPSPADGLLFGPEAPIERSRSVERAGRGEGRFGELRAIWDRGWPGDDAPEVVALARQAFETACREVAPDDIIEAAKVHVAAADAPRFLPALAKWLTARGWEKPPPTKARRGNGRHKGNGSKPLANVFFEEAGYRQDADGHWNGSQQ
jgi:hypothetical protein